VCLDLDEPTQLSKIFEDSEEFSSTNPKRAPHAERAYTRISIDFKT